MCHTGKETFRKENKCVFTGGNEKTTNLGFHMLAGKSYRKKKEELVGVKLGCPFRVIRGF